MLVVKLLVSIVSRMLKMLNVDDKREEDVECFEVIVAGGGFMICVNRGQSKK